MRRVMLPPLLLVLGCSPPPVPAPALLAPSLELTGTKEDATLVGRHNPDGGKAWEVHLRAVETAIAAPDGGAYAIVREKPNDGSLPTWLRVDSRGKEMWRERAGGARVVDATLFATRDRLFALGRKRLDVFQAKSGAHVHRIALDQSYTGASARGDIVALAGEGRVARLREDGQLMWRVRVRRFPGFPAVNTDDKVAVGVDGTVLTGASDGSLLALDSDGHPLWRLGIRGAVFDIAARSDGDFAVLTKGGLEVIVSPRGAVRAETSLTAEILPEIRGIVDLRDGKRAGPTHTAPPPWRPTAAYQARREGPAGKPFGSTLSVLAIAPGDVWVLGRGAPVPGQDPHDYHLYHHDGHAWSELGERSIAFPKEVFVEVREATQVFFTPSFLAQGPTGTLLVIGSREDYLKDGSTTNRHCVLERVDRGFRERRDLFAALSAIPYYSRSLTYAASSRGREVLCISSEPPVCIEAGPGISPRPLPDDQGRRMPGVPDLFRNRDVFSMYTTIPVLFAGETLWRVNGWAREADVWGLDSASVVWSNGSDLERRDAPLGQLRSVWASGRDDLWLTGRRGDREAVARFDGERWWGIAGIDINPDAGRQLAVTGSSRDDVWVYGSSGVWHVTPDPRAPPDVEGTPAPPPPASAPSRALAITGVDRSYRLERVVVEVDGDRPLRTALSIAEGPGGVVWLHEGTRVVEFDGTRSRVVYKAPEPEPLVCWPTPHPDSENDASCIGGPPKPLSCQRCVAPLAAGEGAALTEHGWQRIRGGHAVPESLSLLAPLAVTAAPSGAIWGVSAGGGDIVHAAIDTSAGSRLVAGVPPAAYADVAVRADNDVWMAGGLTTVIIGRRIQAAGEGTLVRFDGRAFTRYRGPDGALLSVAAAGPGEAWAVGLAGGVLHAKAGAVEAFHLTGEDGRRLPVILRGVAAAGPNEVWIVGDSSTLLRWDGKALRRVDASAAGRNAALSAVIAPGVRPGWVVGPGGIWRVVRTL